MPVAGGPSLCRPFYEFADAVPNEYSDTHCGHSCWSACNTSKKQSRRGCTGKEAAGILADNFGCISDVFGTLEVVRSLCTGENYPCDWDFSPNFSTKGESLR